MRNWQRFSATILVSAVTVVFGFLPEARAQPVTEAKMRLFLFISEPNAGAWTFMIENPTDREKAAAQSIEKLGGEMLSYYWGVGNGRNYIIIAMPDDIELIQANYITRLGDGLLNSYKMIELMSSEAMTGALRRVRDVKAVDDIK